MQRRQCLVCAREVWTPEPPRPATPPQREALCACPAVRGGAVGEVSVSQGAHVLWFGVRAEDPGARRTRLPHRDDGLASPAPPCSIKCTTHTPQPTQPTHSGGDQGQNKNNAATSTPPFFLPPLPSPPRPRRQLAVAAPASPHRPRLPPPPPLPRSSPITPHPHPPPPSPRQGLWLREEEQPHARRGRGKALERHLLPLPRPPPHRPHRRNPLCLWVGPELRTLLFPPPHRRNQGPYPRGRAAVTLHGLLPRVRTGRRRRRRRRRSIQTTITHPPTHPPSLHTGSPSTCTSLPIPPASPCGPRYVVHLSHHLPNPTQPNPTHPPTPTASQGLPPVAGHCLQRRKPQAAADWGAGEGGGRKRGRGGLHYLSGEAARVDE